MDKLIGAVYYLSMLIFYGFFILLMGSHIYFSQEEQQIEEKDWRCYAFNDKDSQEVYSERDFDDLHDVSKDFQALNVWGAITYLLIICLIFSLHIIERDSDFDAGCFFLPIAFNILNWLVYFLFLHIYRWRHAGKLCSGDYLEGRYGLFGPDEAQQPYLR